MKVRLIIVMSLGIIITSFVSSCKQKEPDVNKLCEEFYLQNIGKSFDGLYDVLIATSRLKVDYDSLVNQYEYSFPVIAVYNESSASFITIPVFGRGAGLIEKSTAFNKMDEETKRLLSERLFVKSENNLFGAYSHYVDSIYAKYDGLKTPSWYSNKNVIVEGNPRLGKFVTFTLKTSRKVCKCYFVRDKSTLTPYWSRHFTRINKLDSAGWYYEVHDNDAE